VVSDCKPTTASFSTVFSISAFLPFLAAIGPFRRTAPRGFGTALTIMTDRARQRITQLQYFSSMGSDNEGCAIPRSIRRDDAPGVQGQVITAASKEGYPLC
jgi:hypothetical protein